MIFRNFLIIFFLTFSIFNSANSKFFVSQKKLRTLNNDIEQSSILGFTRYSSLASIRDDDDLVTIYVHNNMDSPNNVLFGEYLKLWFAFDRESLQAIKEGDTYDIYFYKTKDDSELMKNQVNVNFELAVIHEQNASRKKLQGWEYSFYDESAFPNYSKSLRVGQLKFTEVTNQNIRAQYRIKFDKYRVEKSRMNCNLQKNVCKYRAEKYFNVKSSSKNILKGEFMIERLYSKHWFDDL